MQKRRWMIAVGLVVFLSAGVCPASDLQILAGDLGVVCQATGGGWLLDYNLVATVETGGMPGFTLAYELVIGASGLEQRIDGTFAQTLSGPMAINGFELLPFPAEQVGGRLFWLELPDHLPMTLPISSVACGARTALGDQGCGPGFWKNHVAAWAAAGIFPDAAFNASFGVDWFGEDFSLADALKSRGGGRQKLARHGTAALLNAASPEVRYPLDVSAVVAAVQGGEAERLAQYNAANDCEVLSGGARP